MSGSLTELSAKGSQDSYLTVSPAITFHKGTYKKHTNFSMEAIEQTFQSAPNYGHKATCTIARNGDLVSQIWLYLELDAIDQTQYAGTHFTDCVGHALIQSCDLDIGGHTFDKQYGEFMEAWDELSGKAGKALGQQVGKSRSDEELMYWAGRRQRLYVPLQFWFCRSSAQALPLISLQYHETRVNVTFRAKSDVIKGPSASAVAGGSQDGQGKIRNCYLLVNYVFLDTMERRLFANSPHEYLITQVQHTGSESIDANVGTATIGLNMNHPVRELIWMFRKDSARTSKDWFDFRGNEDHSDAFQDMKIQLNGHDRFQPRDPIYFRMVQPRQYHSKIPERHVYCYSFALDPEDWKPSGSINMSRIDSVNMKFTFDREKKPALSDCMVFARSMNVMKVVSGMSGLKYAN